MLTYLHLIVDKSKLLMRNFLWMSKFCSRISWRYLVIIFYSGRFSFFEMLYSMSLLWFSKENDKHHFLISRHFYLKISKRIYAYRQFSFCSFIKFEWSSISYHRIRVFLLNDSVHSTRLTLDKLYSINTILISKFISIYMKIIKNLEENKFCKMWKDFSWRTLVPTKIIQQPLTRCFFFVTLAFSSVSPIRSMTTFTSIDQTVHLLFKKKQFFPFQQVTENEELLITDFLSQLLIYKSTIPFTTLTSVG